MGSEERVMAIDHVRRTYEQLGREDPLYAVLSRRELRGNKWDVDAFFATGEREIAQVLDYVQGLGLSLGRDRALDFGCGVGRLSQALGDRFEQVVGVDIADSMIDRAREFNRHGERVEYMVNTRDDLSILGDRRFDFVYSNITLQHIPPEHGENYIRAFFRVLRPGGVVIFQVPSGRAYRPGSLRAWLYHLKRHHLRRLRKRLAGRPPVEIHYIARERVEALIEACSAALVDIVPVGRSGAAGRNFRYCAINSGSPSQM